MSFELNFLCADMFPYEDSKALSVCLYPEKRNHHSFVNISPTLVIDTSMERFSRVLHHGNPPKIDFFPQKSSKFIFDLYWRAEINIQVGSTYISVNYMSLGYMMTSGMHRRSFESRYLVIFEYYMFITWFTWYLTETLPC